MKEETGCPVFNSAVLLVDDVEKSKRFYSVVLGQKIIFDFGRNVVFEGGLAIWKRDYALNLIFEEKKTVFQAGTSNVEFYFETGDLKKLFERLSNEEVEVIHSIREEPWGQNVFRVFDFDRNILEFAEPMESVVIRLSTQGLSLEEIAKKSQMSMDFIRLTLNKQ